MTDRIKILFNAFADKDSFNAQDLNARDIALRLDRKKYISHLFSTCENNIDDRLKHIENVIEC